MNQIDSAYTKASSSRIQQGDILQSVPYLHWVFDEATPLKLFPSQVELPYIVVLTQDCDLQQDFAKREIEKEDLQDHFLHTILVCPAYPSEQFKEGTHLSHWGVRMSRIKNYSAIEDNMHKRYHHLTEDEKQGIPELVLDFKHYYAIPVDALYKLYPYHRFASIKKLFREDLSHRFSFYLSRIGLPDVVPPENSRQTQSANTE